MTQHPSPASKKPATKRPRQGARPKAQAAAKSARQETLARLFEDNTAPERIAKKIAHAGFCSRRDAERWIEAGRVTVNGKVQLSPAYNATAQDIITVDGKPLIGAEAPRLWRYYKPRGLVVSHRDEKDRDTVFDSLPDDLPRVISVGRLDLDSEGLLLLTNSGDLARYLELPDTGWTRKYRVRVRGRVEAEKLTALSKGITIDGIHYRGVDASIDRQMDSNAWLTIILKEGKNREIRRIMEHLGYPVSRLIRVSFGPFKLNQMQDGEVEEVKTNILRDQLGLPRVALRPEDKAKSGWAKPGGAKPGSAKSGARNSGARKAAPKRQPNAQALPKASPKNTSKPAAKSSSRPSSSSRKAHHANHQRQKTRRTS